MKSQSQDDTGKTTSAATGISSELALLINALAEANAKALSEAQQNFVRQQDPTVREREYPGISPLNPEGDLANPRPEIDGEIFLVGWKMDSRFHTHEEIALLNALQPGAYFIRGGDGSTVRVEVVSLEPGIENSRKLYIHVPHQSADQRARLPHSLVDLLKQCVEQANAKPV